MSPSARSLWAALALACALGAVLLWSSCAQSKINQARMFTAGLADATIAGGQVVSAQNEIRSAAVADKLDRREMSTDDGEREKGKLKHQYGIAERTIKSVSAGVAGLRASIQIADAVKKFDLGPLLRSGVQLFNQLQAALKAYGVEIPMPNLGGL